MWNWLVSSLMLNSNVCLYDGSPFYPNSDILWKYAEQENLIFLEHLQNILMLYQSLKIKFQKSFL